LIILLDFGEGKCALCDVSFDYVNPYCQDEVLGTDGWIILPGTGMRGEPFTRLQWYQWRDEVFVDGVEPVNESFPSSDNFQLEVKHLSACILGETAPRYGIDDALANATVLDAVLESIATNEPVAISPKTTPPVSSADAPTSRL
jgi:predicted dehydrogenase